MTTYTVKSGDTLSKIATSLGYSSYKNVPGLTGYNVANPNLIRVGQVLNYGATTPPPVVPTTPINTAITPANLTNPTNPVNIAPTNTTPITDANAMTASAIAQQKLDVQTAADRKVAEADLAKKTEATTSLESIIGTLGTELAGRGTEQVALEREAGIGTMSAEKAAIDSQVATGVAEYNQLKTEFDRVSLENRNKPITMNSIIGSEAAIDFARSQKLNSKAADIGLLQAQSLGKTGQIEAAQKVIDRAVDLKYADKQALLDVKKQQLESLYKNLTGSEKKVADLVKQQYEGQLKDIEDKKSQEKTNFTLKESYAKMAIEGGQNDLGAKISALDVSSPTYQKDLSALQSQISNPITKLDIELKQAQIENEKASTAKIKSETVPGAGKPPTDIQIQSAGYADRIKLANSVIDEKADVFAKMSYIDFKLAESKSQLANFAMSPDIRQASQAMRNFITAKLRKESGAAISQSEFDDARLQYFPALGDDATTLAQKKTLRDTVLNNLIQGAGPAYKEIPTNATDAYFNTSVGAVTKTNADTNANSKEYNFLTSLGTLTK